jgi:hypothetical protein
MQVAHQRLLGRFVEIDQGKQLSVGPARYLDAKVMISPVEEMHSLHFVKKMREFEHIDHTNDKFLNKLNSTQVSVPDNEDLKQNWAHKKKIRHMISKGVKDGISDIVKMRETYLSK